MKKGIALIAVLIIVVLLLGLIGTFLYLITNARLLNARYDENLIALSLAEAGVDYAIWELNFSGADFTSEEGWSGTTTKSKTITNFKDSEGTVYGDIYIEVQGLGSEPVTVISKGILPSSLLGHAVTRKIRVVLTGHKLSKYAIFTVDSIKVGGKALIDSYDSSIGDYGVTYEEGGEEKINIGQDGDVITTGDGDPAIKIYGSSDVQGDAGTASGGVVSVEGSATLSGGTDDNVDGIIFPTSVPDDFDYMTSDGDLSISKEADSVELGAGYHMYDSLSLSGKGTITLNAENGDVNLYLIQNPSIRSIGQSQIIVTSGTANVYFEGDVNLGGQGVFNESVDASTLTFYGTDNVSDISLTGIGEFYGSFYAPSADYNIIGDSKIFGSVTGKTVDMKGTSAIHFDVQLKNDGPSSGYDPQAWQEKYE
jgi:hypothetical protein